MCKNYDDSSAKMKFTYRSDNIHNKMDCPIKLVYSGEFLRELLQKKGMTYKDAAEILSLDKNTVGKAVRGGNLYVNVLLAIANQWQIPIERFFKYEGDEHGISKSYYLSSDDWDKIHQNVENVVRESEEIYKKCQKSTGDFSGLLASRDREIAVLKELVKVYEERIKILEAELFSRR